MTTDDCRFLCRSARSRGAKPSIQKLNVLRGYCARLERLLNRAEYFQISTAESSRHGGAC
jgi:hypothetical protein